MSKFEQEHQGAGNETPREATESPTEKAAGAESPSTIIRGNEDRTPDEIADARFRAEKLKTGASIVRADAEIKRRQEERILKNRIEQEPVRNAVEEASDRGTKY